jgi:hypothetical protein
MRKLTPVELEEELRVGTVDLNDVEIVDPEAEAAAAAAAQAEAEAKAAAQKAADEAAKNA